MNRPKFYEGIKKLAKGAVIVMVLTATLTLSGCMSTEQKEVAKATIAISNNDYTIGDLYLLTSKENELVQYFCTKDKIGSYQSGKTRFSAYCYTDIKTGEVIATSRTSFSFNKVGKERFPTKEEQNKIKKIGKKHVDIIELYKAVDYEIFSEKDMKISEEDIIGQIASKTK